VRSRSNDTRLLVAGVVAAAALMAYLAVAFARIHSSSAAPNVSGELAPWTPYASKLVPIPLRGGRFAVRVTPATRGPAPGGSYGALVQTLAPYPTSGRRYAVGVGLRGAGPGRIGVQIDEFRPGVTRYLVQTTVPATARWHHFRFNFRVKGRWLGLAMYVYRLRQTSSGKPMPFAVRGLTLTVRRR
jgi:hypothetical protein